MKIARRALFLAAALSVGGCGSSPFFEPEVLHVMLQGNSSAELAELVERLGGSLTHDLHLIDAVGAKLTRGQLRRAKKSELVTFYIDDLALEDAPEGDDNDKPCRVRGHIELDIDNSGFSWDLYNKKDEPAVWESLSITWPERLGDIATVRLDDREIGTRFVAERERTSLSFEFPPEEQLILEDQVRLRAAFTTPISEGAPPKQRDFKIEVNFAGDCPDKLVPGYDNNSEDYYYNTVAGVDALHHQGITGDGVTVAVIDSGLWDHPALTLNTRGEQRVLARYDAITGTLDDDMIDDSGHGSHMSSIIAHSGPTLKGGMETGTYKGVAPNANLIAVKVLDRGGSAHILDIAQSVQWVVDNKDRYNIQILNISLAQTPRWPYWEDPVTQLVMHAWAAGITVIAAASNEGPEPMTIGSPGNLPYIITVGAVTDSWTPNTRDDDYIPDFSSRGPTPSGHVKPDIVALGGHMTGLTDPNSDLAVSDPDNILSTGELVSTGSSQAAALVSGIAALLLELEPNLTPDEIKCKLITSAEPAINEDGTLAYSPFDQGYGYVTAPRTVTLGVTDCGPTGLDLKADIARKEHFYGPVLFDEEGNARLPAMDKLVSDEPSAKGMSDTRKWGVKDHIERMDEAALKQIEGAEQPFNWLELYLSEKAAIESLGKQP